MKCNDNNTTLTLQSLDTINLMIAEAEKNARNRYGFENTSADRSHGNGKNSSYWRRDGDHDRKRSRDNSTRREDLKTNSPNRDGRSHRRERDRSRSRSQDRTGRRSRNLESDRNFSSERKKMAFRKPDEQEHSSVSRSGKSHSAVKRWQKPEIKDRIIEQQNEERKKVSTSKPERLEKSYSDRSDSDNDEKEVSDSAPEKTGNEKVLTEAELNKLGAKIVKAEIMGDTVSYCFSHNFFAIE